MKRKCEFILVWDTVMTDSAKYADILLPDAMRSEQLNLQTQGYSECVRGRSIVGDSRSRGTLASAAASYDVVRRHRRSAFGVRDAFTEGRTHDEWVKFLYEQGAEEEISCSADLGGNARAGRIQATR